MEPPNEDDDACCVRCKAIPFLSVVRCKCLPTAVRCIRHAMDACDCAPGDRTLEVRVSDERLGDMSRALLLGRDDKDVADGERAESNAPSGTPPAKRAKPITPVR